MKNHFICILLLTLKLTAGIQFDSLAPQKSVRISGAATNSNLGYSVSSAGDIDGDGYEDVIIGAPFTTGNSVVGVVYVIYGGATASFSDIDFSTGMNLDPATTGFKITGELAVDWLGFSVSAGDIDNDGHDDLIIGAKNKNPYQGAAYVIYGRSRSTLQNIDLSTTTLSPTTTGFLITGKSYSGYFGYALRARGDINGDGYYDMIIGSMGAVYVIYGGPKSTMTNIVLASTTLNPATTGFTVTGSSTSYFGAAVDILGDVDNDGYDDIIIGAYGANSNLGAAYVIYGGTKSTRQNIDLTSSSLDPATTGFSMVVSGSDSVYLGSSVCGADVNGDGYDDVIVAGVNFNSFQGVVYVLYGGARSTFSSSINLSTAPTTAAFSITGNAAGDRFGRSLWARDIDGDGNDDVIIGAFGKNSNNGATYVIYGGKSLANIDLSTTTLDPASTGLTILGTVSGGYFGATVSGADINNDGYVDLIIGAYAETTFAGSSYLVMYTKNPCSDHCTACGFASQCFTCESRYALVDSACVGCPTHCDSCSSSASCDVCDSGYEPVGSGCQVICPSDCESCTSPTSCDVCDSGYEPVGSGCSIITCPSNCESCTSSSSCNVCESGYKPVGSGCQIICPSNCQSCTSSASCDVCDSGYEPVGSGCQAICPSNCESCSSPTSCDICDSGYEPVGSGCSIIICPSNCDSCTSSSSCNVCESGYKPVGSGCQMICPSNCKSCSSATSCQVCADGYTLSEELSCVEQSGEKTKEVKENAAVQVFEGIYLAASSLSFGRSLPFNFNLAVKIVRNSKYLDLTVSSELQEAFVAWKAPSRFIKAPSSWSSKSSEDNLPIVFGRYGLNSAFLINFWQPFILSLIGITLFLAFKLTERAYRKSESRLVAISRQIHIAASNFALILFYGNLDDALFYFILDVRSTKFENGFQVFSCIFAIILLTIGCVLVGFHVLTLSRYQKQKESKAQLESFVAKSENVSLFFKDFKDSGLFIQSFLLINLIRSIICSVIFATLFEHPLLQVSLLFALHIGVVIYLSAKKPFKRLFEFLGQLFCELALFIITICLLILAIFAKENSGSVKTIKQLSKTIIVLNYLLLIGSSILLIIYIGEWLVTSYQEIKKAGRSNKRVFSFKETQRDDQTMISISPPKSSLDLAEQPSAKRILNSGKTRDFDETSQSPIMKKRPVRVTPLDESSPEASPERKPEPSPDLKPESSPIIEPRKLGIQNLRQRVKARTRIQNP